MARTGNRDRRAIHFADLDAPVVLNDAQTLLPAIRQIMPHWPFAEGPVRDDAEPFVEISGDANGFEFRTADNGKIVRHREAVDCLCGLVAETAWEQIRSNPLWLCLHCAAVEFAGRLILFPNRRRAGKSTLAAVIASRGYRVFTDDFLPVEVDASGAILGRANGVEPRLRRPLPDNSSEWFSDWVEQNPGAQSRRYKYLATDRIAPHGERLPIGAVVILDRQDLPVTAAMDSAAAEETMDVLIHQNFARILHSGRIVQASRGVVETADLHRLSYYSAEEAADLLERQFETWQTPVRHMAAPESLQQKPADLSILGGPKPKLDTSQPYRQSGNATEVAVGAAIYLADPDGLGIQKLNPICTAIWRLLAHPVTVDDIAELLSAAFPETGEERILRDTTKTLERFARRRLITPDADDAMAAE